MIYESFATWPKLKTLHSVAKNKNLWHARSYAHLSVHTKQKRVWVDLGEIRQPSHHHR